jgi:hypothetical protein
MQLPGLLIDGGKGCAFIFALLTYRAVKRIEVRLNPPS